MDLSDHDKRECELVHQMDSINEKSKLLEINLDARMAIAGPILLLGGGRRRRCSELYHGHPCLSHPAWLPALGGGHGKDGAQDGVVAFQLHANWRIMN